MLKKKPEDKKVIITMSITPKDLEFITAYCLKHDMSRSRFLVRCSKDYIKNKKSSID